MPSPNQTGAVHEAHASSSGPVLHEANRESFHSPKGVSQPLPPSLPAAPSRESPHREPVPITGRKHGEIRTVPDSSFHLSVKLRVQSLRPLVTVRSLPRSGKVLTEQPQSADKTAEFTCAKSSSRARHPAPARQARLPAATAATRHRQVGPPRSANPSTALPRRLHQEAVRPQRAGPGLAQFGARAGPARAARRGTPNPAGPSGAAPPRRPHEAGPGRAAPGQAAPPQRARGTRGRAAMLTPPPQPCCLAGLRLSRDGGAGRGRGAEQVLRGARRRELGGAVRSGKNYKNKHEVIV